MLRLPYRDNHSVLAEKFSAQLQCSSRTVHSICEDKAGLGEQGRSIKIPYEHRRQSQRGTFIKCPHASTHTSANYPHRGGETVSFLQHRLLTDHKEKIARSQHSLVSACVVVSNWFVKKRKEITVSSSLDEHVPSQPRVYASHTDMCDHSITKKGVREREQKRQKDTGR